MVGITGYIKETVRVFRRRPALNYTAAVVPFLIMFLVLFLVGRSIRFILAAHGQMGPYNPAESWYSMEWWARLGVILAFVFSAWAPQAIAASGIALLTWEDCEGRAVTVHDMAAATLRRVLPLIVLGFTIGLGGLVGTLLLFIPGWAFLALSGFAIPAAIVENLGPLESLKRSFRLTRGRRIPLIGIVLAAMVVVAASRIMVDQFLSMSVWMQVFALLVFLVIIFTLSVFVSILFTLLYRQARTERETSTQALSR